MSKLYKFDYRGTIGENVITVPTDSQFLIGIGNGDLSSATQLFDGNTEILPEDEKIGEYTCFKMETQGTQFRKPYKAVITGYKTEYVNKDTNTYEHSNFIADIIIPEDTYELDGTTNKKVPWKGEGQRPDKVEVRYRDTNGEVLGIVKYHFAAQIVSGGTLRVTWKIDEEFESFGYACVNIWFKASAVYQWNKVAFKKTSESQYDEISKNETGTPVPIEVNIPYTQNISLMVICQKQSVAYRDLEGSGGTTTLPYLKERAITETTTINVTPENAGELAHTIFSFNFPTDSATHGVNFHIDDADFEEAHPAFQTYVYMYCANETGIETDVDNMVKVIEGQNEKDFSDAQIAMADAQSGMTSIPADLVVLHTMKFLVRITYFNNMVSVEVVYIEFAE